MNAASHKDTENTELNKVIASRESGEAISGLKAVTQSYARLRFQLRRGRQARLAGRPPVPQRAAEEGIDLGKARFRKSGFFTTEVTEGHRGKH